MTKKVLAAIPQDTRQNELSYIYLSGNFFFQSTADCGDEFVRGKYGRRVACPEHSQILCHAPGGNHLKAGALQRFGKFGQRRDSVQLAALCKRTRPGKDGCDWIC